MDQAQSLREDKKTADSMIICPQVLRVPQTLVLLVYFLLVKKGFGGNF